MDKQWSKFCCNPFHKDKHWVTKNLRNVPQWMIKLNDNIEDGMKICTSCRLWLSKKKAHSSSESDTSINDELLAENTKPGCSKDDSEYMDVESGLDFLNASLTSIGEHLLSK